MGAEEGEAETMEGVARAAGKRKSMPPVQLTSSLLRASACASQTGERAQEKQAAGKTKGKHEREEGKSKYKDQQPPRQEVEEGGEHQCPTCLKFFASLQVSLLLQLVDDGLSWAQQKRQ